MRHVEFAWPGALPTFEDGPASEYVVSRIEASLRRTDLPAPHRKITGTARFGWAQKTRDSGRVPQHALIPSAADLRGLGLFAPDLPWLEPGSVAEELAMFGALRQVESWAKASLPPAGPSV